MPAPCLRKQQPCPSKGSSSQCGLGTLWVRRGRGSEGGGASVALHIIVEMLFAFSLIFSQVPGEFSETVTYKHCITLMADKCVFRGLKFSVFIGYSSVIDNTPNSYLRA